MFFLTKPVPFSMFIASQNLKPDKDVDSCDPLGLATDWNLKDRMSFSNNGQFSLLEVFGKYDP